MTIQMKRELFLTSNKLHTLNGGLYNIFNRQVDYIVCKALEKLISLNKSYGMGIVRNENLLGSLVILTRYAYDIKDTRIIETLMYQASIALQRRMLEKEFIAAKEKAEESDKLKTAFLANMSHEIRTPVNGIIGFSQLLQDNNLTEDKRKEFIEIIKANADSLITLIDDILDVSIIQEGLVKLRKATININLILDELHTTFTSHRYKEKEIKFEILKSLADESAVILADPFRIKQVLTNLISNAFKFTEKGRIVVGYVIEPGFIRFYVKDTGIGISPEKQDSIFQRFTQGDTSYTRQFSGSGLGLAISKGLIEIMSGKIWVKSKPGEGSEFSFTLPHHDIAWRSPDALAKSAESNPSLLN
jgi:signal transduction histidine kinase